MFLGDSVASEASWGTMRYLLAAPVPRRRFLYVKVTVGILLTLAVLLTLVLASFVIGLIAFGTGALASPLSGTLGVGESTIRLGVITGYIAVTLLVPAGIAFLASVSTDVPLGAVGAAVVIVIFANILDAIDALGSIRRTRTSNRVGPDGRWPGVQRRRVRCAGRYRRLAIRAKRHSLVDRASASSEARDVRASASVTYDRSISI
jgi:ABC-type transport system involved in multi-copper enzyme maturation permease subunit